ncbi:MAG: hypothetical protein CM1200mP18_14910 [Gammaproteobacteria bacterium]|nr:MAG: hypothetical protein CM1200mP18_14910 [Gammaproteobacteria bacterium]
MVANRLIESYETSGAVRKRWGITWLYTRARRWSWERHFELMYLLFINHAGFYDLCTELSIPHAESPRSCRDTTAGLARATVLVADGRPGKRERPDSVVYQHRNALGPATRMRTAGGKAAIGPSF